ncbi:MAG: DNA polymerase III subunit alpha [Treponema sp.]|jgi:DNA polymerase-3 subunit alpha|nr:DNA polymerase III subunit alpha [Treponema sp.]
MTDFVHLHVHSDFSLLDAAAPVMGLADKAEALGMKSMALTDHGNMFGTMEFIAACEETINEEGQHEKRKNPVKPIIGCEAYVAAGSRFEKKAMESEDKYYHLVLLAMNREGYHNLVRLCSFAYTEGFYRKPKIDEELLAQYHTGLIALSACVAGEIPRLIRAGKPDEAEKKALHYRELFGKDENGNPNFYLEIQDHGIPAERLRGTLSQRDINKAIIDIAKKTGIPLVATNDVHYLNREDYVAHDTLLCIGTAQTRNAEKRKKQYYGDKFYLKSGDEMAALFPDCPEAIANTVRIAERCNADVPKIKTKDLPKYLPDFEIPKDYENADAYLRRLTTDGLAKRYAKEKNESGKPWELIQERMEYELNTIIQMGFTGYFLIVVDFINWAKERGIPVGPGRGSGGGSIVAYSLRITDIDPFKYNLLFERFLNPERISMPDFDVDFANEGRDDVITYVTEKYGRDRVGQIITFGTLGAKAVIKDVARTLSISIPESDMITKLIPRDPKITLAKAIRDEPRLQELEQDPRYKELFELARKLEGLNRHSSIHASGVVIGKYDLHDLVPLYKDPKTGAIATQFDMNHLEKSGLVKMDFLGLKTLDVIKHTEELIRDRGGEYAKFDVEKVNEDDKATFKMLSEGMSFEVFQFESDGMQDVLKRARPDKIEDLIALNALYRPGPMANIPRFIDCKNGRQRINYPDPSLEEILRETYGVIVYQEQVMQVARIIAGYSLGQADILRKAMGKKILEILDKEKIPFLEGATRQGYSREKAEEIFDMLIPFAGYGFNKSHAAGYAVLAYRTAYLKANFPAEFMAANLTNEINSTDKDKLSVCIAEARKMGIAVDPPDINRSNKLFTISEGRIVYGFLGIKGLGDVPSDEIVNCRKEGPYRDFMDFLNRVDIKAIGKSVIERLIQTGAFDNLGTSRGTLLGNFERAVEYIQNIKDEKKFGQGSLFGDTGEKEYQDFGFEEFPETSREDKLKIEKELIGFYFSGHPMDEYKGPWQSLVKVNLGNEKTLVPGSQILVGLIKTIRITTTNRGEKMAYVSLEDYNGEIEVTFFPGIWEKCKDSLETGKVAILKGKIDYQQSRDKRSFIADECLDVNEAEKLSKAEEARSRKWEKYRNIWKYAAELNLRIPDLRDPGRSEGDTYTVLGMLKSLRTHIDKNGKEMAFGTIEDFRGEIDLVFFSRAWENCKALTAVDEVFALKGTIEPARDRNSGKVVFNVSSVQDLNKLLRAAAKKAEEAPEKSVAEEPAAMETADKETKASESAQYRELHIRLAASAANNEAALNSLKRRLYENPGSCPVYLHIPASSEGTASKDSSETVIRTANHINAVVLLSDLSPEKYAAVVDVWGK